MRSLLAMAQSTEGSHSIPGFQSPQFLLEDVDRLLCKHEQELTALRSELLCLQGKGSAERSASSTSKEHAVSTKSLPVLPVALSPGIIQRQSDANSEPQTQLSIKAVQKPLNDSPREVPAAEQKGSALCKNLVDTTIQCTVQEPQEQNTKSVQEGCGHGFSHMSSTETHTRKTAGQWQGQDKEKWATSNWYRASHEQAVAETLDRALVRYDKSKLGFWESLRTSTEAQTALVDNVMSIVIVVNTAVIGISADVSPQAQFWLVVDTMFAVIFLCELSAKLILQGKKYFCGPDAAWNMFDALLVASAFIELIVAFVAMGASGDEGGMNLSLFRILRLVRITKVARLGRFKIFADLVMMLNGAVAGVKTLMWAVFLISIPLYAMALVMREALGKPKQTADVDAEMFGTVGESFFTLFRCLVGGDCSNEDGKPVFVLLAKDHGWFYAVLYMITLCVMMVGILNVIAAMYVENVVEAGKRNQSLRRQRRLMDQRVMVDATQELLLLMWEHNGGARARTVTPEHQDGVDSEGVLYSASTGVLEEAANFEISMTFFQELCNDQRFHDILTTLDVPQEDRQDLFDTLDVDGQGTIDLHEFIGGLSHLRGEPRRSDTVLVRLIVRQIQQELADFKKSTMDALLVSASMSPQAFASVDLPQ